jgi:peptide/nickel transport system substrate-binding protein
VQRTPGASLEVRAVAGHHRGKPSIDRVIWSVTPEYRAGILKLKAGDADVFANVRKETIGELTGSGNFKLLSLPGMDYAFMQMNLRDRSGREPHPLFGSRELRRALTMALDREAMVKNLFDTLGSVAIGPAVRASATTDTSLRQIPFDREAARRALDSLGWTVRPGSAVRSRGGIPLRFRLIVPVSSQTRMNIAVLIQEQLAQVGAEVIIEQMDYSAFTARQAERSFDAALGSWTLGSSPEAVRVTWTSSAAKRGGLNYGAYANPRFDALVDSALKVTTAGESRELFRMAHQVIIDDAPAVWLYEPRFLLAVHSRIVTPPMRPNSWWLSIPAWKIAVDKRLPRDGVPPRD